jgi:hypothetical protein
MNNTLIIGATHGNEPIGVRALEQLDKQRSDFDWVIGNPRAFEQEVRFTDTDLNRSAPGNTSSEQYEERRAAELVALSKKYQATIDIHGTSKNTGCFIIITNPSKENIELAKQLDVERVVYWPALTPELEGPISEFFPVGLEIECGPKEEKETQAELERILNQYLDGKPRNAKQKFYEVYGQLEGESGVELREFEEVTVGDETFAPLLVGSYKESYGVSCFKLREWNTQNPS